MIWNLSACIENFGRHLSHKVSEGPEPCAFIAGLYRRKLSFGPSPLISTATAVGGEENTIAQTHINLSPSL